MTYGKAIVYDEVCERSVLWPILWYYPCSHLEELSKITIDFVDFLGYFENCYSTATTSTRRELEIFLIIRGNVQTSSLPNLPNLSLNLDFI
jgi:hypothetical protein